MRSGATSGKTPMDIRFLIRREQAAILTRAAPMALLANTGIAASIAMMMARVGNNTFILLWLLGVVGINAARYVSLRIAGPTRLIERFPSRILAILATGSLVGGLAWACLCLWSAAVGMLMHPAMAFVICGVCAGSVVLSPIYRLAVWPFVLPILLTYLACLLMEHSFAPGTLSIDIVLFIVLLYRASARAEAAFEESSRIKYEATDLAVSLRHANDTAFAANKRLEFLATHDPLTGLANRAAFNETLYHAMQRARTNGNEVALVLIDLDRFKSINDTFGHAAGDHVLVEAARRLREVVGEADFVARLGGDEFAIVLEGARIDGLAQAVARAAIDLLSQPIPVAERILAIGGSIGISLFPRDGYSVEELQISADVALYAAKGDGRGRVREFDAKLRADADARRVYELDLAEAIAEGAIEVWFQPQVRLADRKLCGLEALIRWNHPNHGWVPPPEIVAAAAATRLSEALTGHVIEASCRMVRALDEVGRSDVAVSFNASPQELAHYSLPDLLSRALAAHAIAPQRLEVEITEESMFRDDHGAAVLRQIAGLGVNIAIDDFGVGYSSFGALRQQAFNCIKIDRVFIEGLTSGGDGRALVQAILGVARALGVKAIAEGVETAEQAAILLHLGCQEVQGYHFGRPMRVADLMAWIRDTDSGSREPELPLFDGSRVHRLTLTATG